MNENTKTLGTRLLACLAGGVVLAMMYGPQEGSSEDYGLAFHQAVLAPRILLYLGLGILAFLAITFWPVVRPYLTKPGSPSFLAGAVTVVASFTLLAWYDPIGKLGDLSTAVADTNGLSFLTSAYFGWLHWTALLVVLVAGGFAIATQNRTLGWVMAAVAAAFAVLTLVAKFEVADFDNRVDHSLGAYVGALGFLVMAVALGAAAVTRAQVTRTREALETFMRRWPGLPLVVIGAVLGLCAFSFVAWFAPFSRNTNLAGTHDLFQGTGLQHFALYYLGGLAWVFVGVTAVAGLAATYLKVRWLGWVTGVLGVVSIVATLVTMYKFSKLAADQSFEAATGPWQNLGVGGWVACIAFMLIGGAGVVAATSQVPASERVVAGDGARRHAHTAEASSTTEVADGRDATREAARTDTAVSSDGLIAGMRSRLNVTNRSLVVVGIALAFFFPPTMTDFWQKVLVTEIGVYVLLAVGLNVVVGWAGLLDLGFIAFYAIGSYTTAYLVGSLPVKPPSWLQVSPLVAIPFAILVCLLAGVLLGAPTLRLRGDYLAIVTLGFGEIIRITAINNPGNFTNSTRGPTPAVPHPVINLGPVKITWGLNNLQYWYLLLVLIVIVVLLFHRLEGSRIGRAWAAIREDEVAAQATGINTTRIKLLAFAIGASTSGLAGVFFASQVGFFTPDNFLLNNSILVVAYVVFGGMGSLPGAMAGAAVLTWLPEFLKAQVPANDRQMWIGAVVLAMMIFRPAGLIPARRRKAELVSLHDDDAASVRAVPAAEGS